MEPGFHTGDLAILRPADSYAVGDVVAYRSESLDTIVMHRIVAGDGERFVTQGDNNDWLDEDRPTEDEILGTLFLRVPQGGKALGAAPLARRPGGPRGGRVRRRRPAAPFARPAPRRGPAGARPAAAPEAGARRAVAPLASRCRSERCARQVALGSAVVAILAAGAARRARPDAGDADRDRHRAA